MARIEGIELKRWSQELPQSFEEGGEVLHDARNTIKRFSLDGGSVVVKRYHRYGLPMRLIRTLGHSNKAQSAYDNARELLRMGFRTPKPLGVRVMKGLGGIVDSYYMCAETKNLPIKAALGCDDWDRDLAKAFGQYVARLHQHGVLHYDLNITNVLFEKVGDTYQFELIDVNRMDFTHSAIDVDDCLENLTLFTGRMDLFEYVVQHYAEARGWGWDKVARAICIKQRHDRLWRLRKRLRHPLRKVAVLLPLLLVSQWCMAQCDVAVKNADKANFDKAVSAYESKHFVEANTLLKKLSAKNPKSADIFFYLGMVAAKQDENPAAIRRYFTKCIDLCPDYPNALAHYYMAVIHYTDARYEQAVQELNTYFELTNNSGNPDYESAYAEASSYLYWSQFLAEAEMNKAPFDPQLVRGLSSKENEMLPYFTWDGQEAYYIRMVPEDLPPTFYERQMVNKVPRLMVSRRLKDGSYSSGDVLPAPFNQHDNEGGVTITAGHEVLYYSVLNRERSGYNNCDIYYSEFRGGVWTDIQSAGPQVNSDKSWDSQPSISPDGQTLYFASNRPGGMGGTDIWRCHKLPNGDWSRAENLGSSINTSGNEKCPFIHADGHTLYFASDGWQGFGGYDMYFANLADNNAAFPTNMGLPINTESDDICLGVNADGSKAYFAGKQPGAEFVGGKDVYAFELYPAARPEPMKALRCSVVDVDSRPLNGSFAVKRYGADEAVYTGSTLMLSLKEDNIVAASADGYVPQVDCYAPKQVRDLAEGEVVHILSPLKVGSYAALKQIRLSADKKSLTPVSKKILDEYVLWLQSHPMVHIEVQGSSLLLSQAVYDYLVQSRLRKERLSIGNAFTDSRFDARLTIKKL